MSEEQMKAGLEAIKLIIASGIGGTIASLAGSWFVNKKLQAQEYEHNQQLESLKSKLENKNTVHKLQFEKEFELYGELWKVIVEVRKTVIITPTIDFLPDNKSVYDVYRERYEKAIDAFNKAKNFFEDHRPFYHDDVSKITKLLLSECRKYITDVDSLLKSGKNEDDLNDKADELFKKIPNAIDKIEEVIKVRIGLLLEANITE